MATLVHFNITANDPGKLGRFYTELFGWQIEPFPGPPDAYALIQTKDLEGKTGIGGGIAKREGEQQTGIINYMGVISIDQTLAKIKNAGGKIVQTKQVVPGFGFLAICQDPEQNVFGIFEEHKQ